MDAECVCGQGARKQEEHARQRTHTTLDAHTHQTTSAALGMLPHSATRCNTLQHNVFDLICFYYWKQ